MTAPSYSTPHEALKGAFLWLGFLLEAAEIDPEDTTFTARVRGAEGEVVQEIEIKLSDSLAEFKRIIDLYEPVVYPVDAAEGEEHENSRGEET